MKKYEIEIKTSFINTIFAGIAISIILQAFFHLFGSWSYYPHGCLLYCLNSSHFISFDDIQASPSEVYELLSIYKIKKSFLLSFDSHWVSLTITSILATIGLNLIKLVDFKIINKDGSKLKITNDLEVYLSILLIVLIIGIVIYNIFNFNN